ncbi:hypothetical protein AUJ66_02575 [Candidatus Desantisbacteria bacterium CG1_02_38_46]|uniref:Uncharacterized protein n=2 Tax=unclassified Candidatus Desantisiibacteriota TaxID=3106372 RepID=A0A1J4SG20_9BACT|nr:MAG: hypothetical protein AUJ66_02575 [Candidatus Desantisbacteria bacterium CG1_02_38_46]PIU52082.1 MAG: hypothetical protein COS91_00960 [Candidatus Desantisbacteria bacterium CG07_land_8_20_14_0_80_39_15]
MNDSNDKFFAILELVLPCSVHFLELYTADYKKPEEYGEATLFEICVYLLFRLDLSLVKLKQKPDVRKKLIFFIADNLVDKFSKLLKNDNLYKIINQRMDIYGKVVRTASEKIFENLHFHLFNNIEFSRNTDELKFWDSGIEPVMLVGLSKEMSRSINMVFIENLLVSSFGCCLKHLFQDNDDFTQLSLSEIEKRIKKGMAEAKKIDNKIFNEKKN